MEKCHCIEPFLFHDIALVAKRLESEKSVVIAGTAHAHTAKGNFKILDLDNGVVHASGTRCGMAQNVIDIAFVCTENVQRKRFWAALYKCDCFVESLVGDNRHNRSENFGLHDFHVGRDVGKHCNWRVAIFDIAHSADDLLSAFGNCILDECGMALCGALVDDVYKVFAFMALGFGIAESALDIFGKCCCKFLNFVFRAKGVIRCNAGLPAI